MLNPNFGTNVPSYRPDPDWINGWGQRPYNWQTSVTVDRELLPNLVVNAGYYRTWFGNFMVIDNQTRDAGRLQPVLRHRADRRAAARSAASSSAASTTSTRTSSARVDNLVTRATNYGKQDEIYNGVDVNFQLRLRDRATLGGGWNIGNAVQLGHDGRRHASAGTDNCYVVDSPQQLFNCDVDVRIRAASRSTARTRSRWDIQVAAVARATPARTTRPTWRSRPRRSSRRSAARCRRRDGDRDHPARDAVSLFGPRINQLDLRATKIFRFGEHPLQANSTPTTCSTSTHR